MADSELVLRCFEPKDEPECLKLFRDGMTELIPALHTVELKGYLKCAMVIVPAFVALTWSLRYLLVLLLLTSIIAAFAYGVVYYEMMVFIKESFANDLRDIAKYYQDGSCMFVAVLEGKIVGMAGVLHRDHHKPGEAEVLRMSVNPSIRKRGIATKLLKEIQQFCQDNNYTKLTLATTNGQHAAMALYGKHGFKVTHRESPWPFLLFVKLVFHEKVYNQ